ncbi:unnamed protein product, partial [Didymodactylos carnosus]
ETTVKNEISTEAKNLVEQLRSDTAIEYLRIDNLSTKDPQAISEGVKVNTNVAGLYFEHPKNLSFENMKCVLVALKTNRTIRWTIQMELVLHSSEVSACFETVAHILQVSTSLRGLHIRDGALKDDHQLEITAEALKENETFAELILLDNQTSDEGIVVLSEMLKVNKTLAPLSLDGNNITDRGIK